MPTTPRYVLVTGASRGLGRDMALHLVRHGLEVLAGVRTVADGALLAAEAGPALHPVILDVTDPLSITAAAQRVTELTGEAGLAGLVNNAGIASFGPLEQQPMEHFEEIFRVNVFGVQALTQALLPLLRRTRGRVVNIWGMHVVVVEPGAMGTDIRLRAVDEWTAGHAALPQAEQGLYANQLATVTSAIQGMEAGVGPAGDVSQAVLQALTDPEPRTRYPVGPHMDQLDALGAMPDRERDRFAAGILGLVGQ
jgi:hypothetical protein